MSDMKWICMKGLCQEPANVFTVFDASFKVANVLILVCIDPDNQGKQTVVGLCRRNWTIILFNCPLWTGVVAENKVSAKTDKLIFFTTGTSPF